MRTPTRSRELFTPHTRSLIAHAVLSTDPHEWHGRRKGVYAFLRLNPCLADPCRVLWTANPATPNQGKSSTVFGALLEIETAAAHYAPQPKDTPSCSDQIPLNFSDVVTRSTRRTR